MFAAIKGSDDETILWAWGDGTTTSTVYLNAPPAADPNPSPQVNPRDIIDTPSHAWQNPCVYTTGLTATDDDGGTDADSTTVLVTGNTTTAWSSGCWKYVLSSGGAGPLSPATLSGTRGGVILR